MHSRSGGQCRWPVSRRAWHAALALVGVSLGIVAPSRDALAVNPDSPEVQKLVASALKYLAVNGDERLGGKCLIALAFHKAGQKNHSRISEAVSACAKTVAENPEDATLDVYSNGLAVIFLCELGPKKYSREIQWFLGRLKERQKSHGGWGYYNYETGDTSQTQYGALCYWEANRQGFQVDGNSVEEVADWLMRTQDPDGCWGYQGMVSGSSGLVEQTDKNCSMLAAGLGSIYICADLMNFGSSATPGAPAAAAPDNLPAALRRADEAPAAIVRQRIRPQRTNKGQLLATIGRAHGWLEKNYRIDIGPKCFYYLYGLERAKSFQELFEGAAVDEPKWYNDGYEFLAKSQGADGSWAGYCGAPCDTAFATLFLLRSTQKSLRSRLGEGTLLAGRGLPRNLSRAKMVRGQVVVEQVRTKVDELLSMIDDDNEGMLDDLARDPSQLVIEKVDAQSARRLQQLVRGGEPEVRLLAVRALGRTGELDYVPTLLYALTDPDRRIVLEARDSLRFISRDFQGHGPPDEFTEREQFEAVDAWKTWYKSIRPNAVLEN